MAKTTKPTPKTAKKPAKNVASRKKGKTSSNKAKAKVPPPSVAPPPWWAFVRQADENEIKKRFASEAKQILDSEKEVFEGRRALAILDSKGYISPWDLDGIYAALSRPDAQRSQDVVLFLISGGGAIEPAYQISKLCKSTAKERFVVVVPRQAKSAATLLALGGDEIHIGSLGHLGPIDPQLGGLPALGVAQALRSIADVAQQYPGSADMLAKYLQSALTVEQIGYCERISESAIQYAERLLARKPSVAPRAKRIARTLVHEYKDHGFIIDLEEARALLGKEWIKTGTAEIRAAERLYQLLEEVNLFLDAYTSRRLVLSGELREDSMLLLDTRRR